MPLRLFCLFNLFLSPILKLRSLFLPSPPGARAPRSGRPVSASRQARGAGPPVGFARRPRPPDTGLPGSALQGEPRCCFGGGSPRTRRLSCCAGAAPRVPWRRQIPGRFHGGAAGLRSRSRGGSPGTEPPAVTPRRRSVSARLSRSPALCGPQEASASRGLGGAGCRRWPPSGTSGACGAAVTPD